MKKPFTIPGAEPFFFSGGKTGCLLVHGFTGTSKEMRLMGDFLNKKGLTVMGIRLAGHATNPRDMIRTRWPDWLASVEDGFNFMRESCEILFAAGLSLGGILSLTAASYLEFEGVIAMSTPYSLPEDWRLKIAKPLSILVPYVDKGKSETKDVEQASEHIDYAQYPTRSIAELRDLIQVFHGQLSKITTPVLLINSKSDKTVPISQMEQIASQLTSASVTKYLIEKSGHVITEDIEREMVFQKADQFIEDTIKAISEK